MKLEKELDIYIDNDQTVSNPKLSLYSLPSKPLTPPGILTPPLHTTIASIPFQWEEAPGKPRVPTMIINNGPTSTTALLAAAPYSKSKAARCLDLPPRLTLNDQWISGKITSVPSPTTVLEGLTYQDDQEEDNDHEGRSNLTHTMSFSSFDGDHQEEKVGGGGGRSRKALMMRSVCRKSFSFSSWRWGSFRDNRKASVGSFEFSSSTHGGSGVQDGSFEDDDSKKAKKIAKRVRRRSSFLIFSNNSNLVASVYGSIKQALPWRRRGELDA